MLFTEKETHSYGYLWIFPATWKTVTFSLSLNVQIKRWTSSKVFSLKSTFCDTILYFATSELKQMSYRVMKFD